MFVQAQVEKGTFNDEEQSFVAWASRPVIDRDNEIIAWNAWDTKNYDLNPTILWAHDYRAFPLGSSQWTKKTRQGLKFKPGFTKAYPDGGIVYLLYQDGSLRAFSVGFIPKKWITGEDDKKGIWSEWVYVNDNESEKIGYIFDAAMDWTEDKAVAWDSTCEPVILDIASEYDLKASDPKPDKIYTLAELLEISCVPVGSCPIALVEAYKTGSIKTKGLIDYVEKNMPIHKPETTENYHRVPVPGRTCEITATITISAEKGIKGLYCGKEKKVRTYLFDKDKWTMEEAKKWVEEHDSGKDAPLFVFVDVADDLEAKGVIPYRDLGKTDEGTAWDAGAEVRAADVADLKLMCAWFKSDEPDVKGSYKLPHHKAAGGHLAVWRGVAAAMGAVLGARGGVDIPPGDRKGVYNHLSKHYGQFDKEPPEFREYSEAELRIVDTLIDKTNDVEAFYDKSLEMGLTPLLAMWHDTIKVLQIEDNPDDFDLEKIVAESGDEINLEPDAVAVMIQETIQDIFKPSGTSDKDGDTPPVDDFDLDDLPTPEEMMQIKKGIVL